MYLKSNTRGLAIRKTQLFQFARQFLVAFAFVNIAISTATLASDCSDQLRWNLRDLDRAHDILASISRLIRDEVPPTLVTVQIDDSDSVVNYLFKKNGAEDLLANSKTDQPHGYYSLAALFILNKMINELKDQFKPQRQYDKLESPLDIFFRDGHLAGYPRESGANIKMRTRMQEVYRVMKLPETRLAVFPQLFDKATGYLFNGGMTRKNFLWLLSVSDRFFSLYAHFAIDPIADELPQIVAGDVAVPFDYPHESKEQFELDVVTHVDILSKLRYSSRRFQFRETTFEPQLFYIDVVGPIEFKDRGESANSSEADTYRVLEKLGLAKYSDDLKDHVIKSIDHLQIGMLTAEQRAALKGLPIIQIRSLLGQILDYIEFHANNRVNVDGKNDITSKERRYKHQRHIKIALTYLVAGGDVNKIRNDQNRIPYELDAKLSRRDNIRRVMKYAIPYLTIVQEQYLYNQKISDALLDILTDMYASFPKR